MLKQISSGTVSNTITIRSIKPRFSDGTRDFWFDNNPYTTHMINVLSFQFPSGEQMFVNAVNYYKDQITDKNLKKAILAFSAQELLHGSIHQEFNNWIATRVPDASDYCDKLAAASDRRYAKHLRKNPIRNLSATVALEHLTATLASSILRRADLLEVIDPEVRYLLIWHAIEEIEHKSVAFDVFQAVGGTYSLRVVSMLMATAILTAQTTFYMFKLLRRDKQVFNLKAALRFVLRGIGPKGYFISFPRYYLRYFSPRFHPSQQDDSELLEIWSKKLAELTPCASQGR